MIRRSFMLSLIAGACNWLFPSRRAIDPFDGAWHVARTVGNRVMLDGQPWENPIIFAVYRSGRSGDIIGVRFWPPDALPMTFDLSMVTDGVRFRALEKRV